jgi:hypothetical protein
MTKRSPRYPRQNLNISLEMVKKVFEGVHQSQVDADTAAKLIGYTNSRSGAAAGALGALRQYGLLDGLRGGVSVSELSMRILQPMDEQERAVALHEAASKPEMFGRIISQFGGRLPSADEPIRAFLIRQEGFSSGGANELIKTVRDTLGSVPNIDQTPDAQAVDEVRNAKVSRNGEVQEPSIPSVGAENLSSPAQLGELITLPLGNGARAELRLVGDISATSYARLIRHLELIRDMAADEQGG